MSGREKSIKIEIYNNCPSDGSNMSGADNRSVNYSSIFKEKGYELHVYTHASIKDRYVGKGYNIIVTSAINGKKWSPLITYVWNGIKACLLQKRDQISITYSSHGLADVMPAILRKLRDPSVEWISGFHLVAPNPFKGYEGTVIGKYKTPSLAAIYEFSYQRLLIPIMRWLDCLVMVSNGADREFFLKKRFSPNRVIVVYGGVDWDDVENASEEAKKYDACFVGRVHPQKGIPDLLDAWEEVCSKKKELKLAMVGHLDKLKKDVFERGLRENIRFLGILRGKEKFKALKSSRIFLLPSYYEGCAIVVAEAMACGLPVVAYDLPVLREVYPKGVVRVAIGDKKSFSRAIIELLSDEKKHLEMSNWARKTSEKFSWEKSVGKILDNLQTRVNV